MYSRIFESIFTFVCVTCTTEPLAHGAHTLLLFELNNLFIRMFAKLYVISLFINKRNIFTIHSEVQIHDKTFVNTLKHFIQSVIALILKRVHKNLVL